MKQETSSGAAPLTWSPSRSWASVMRPIVLVLEREILTPVTCHKDECVAHDICRRNDLRLQVFIQRRPAPHLSDPVCHIPFLDSKISLLMVPRRAGDNQEFI